jgi:hypothetical protein
LRAFALDFLEFLAFAVFAFALPAGAADFLAAFLAGFRLTAFFAFRAATLAPRVARVTARFTVRRIARGAFAVFLTTTLAAPEIAAPAP